LRSCCMFVCSGCLSCFALGCFWFVGWTWLLEILVCILWESRVAASFARSLFKSASSVEKGFPLHGEKCHRVPSCHPCSFLSLLTPGQVKEGLQFPIHLFFDNWRCLSSFILYLLQCPFVARTEGRPFKKAVVKAVFLVMCLRVPLRPVHRSRSQGRLSEAIFRVHLSTVKMMNTRAK